MIFNVTLNKIRAMSVDSRFIYLASPLIDINQFDMIDFNCSGSLQQHIITFLFVSSFTSINATIFKAINLESNQTITFLDLSNA